MEPEITGKDVIKATLDYYFRCLRNLDKILIQWETSFYTKRQTLAERSTNVLPLYTLLKDFILQLLGDPLSIRIENNFVFFHDDSIFRLDMSQFDNSKSFLIIDRWFMVFRTKSLIGTTHKQTIFTDCLLTGFAETIYPRFEMVLRYMCLNLKQHPDNVTWVSFYKVAVHLITIPAHARVGSVMLNILRKKNTFDLDTWNPARDPFPGFSQLLVK